MGWQRFRVNIDKRYKPDERKAIAEAIIDQIQNRSASGTSLNGKAFRPYTKKYADRKGSRSVDLILSGEMLESIRLISESSGTLLIGYEKGAAVNGKAEGNHLGTYGGNAKKPRPFLGIQQQELSEILRNFPLNTEE